MGRKSQTYKLNIYLQGNLVGEYTKKPDGSTVFQYDKLWVKHGFAISQSLPLVTTAYKGDVARAYFENLLPDLKEVRDSIASKMQAKSSEHFDLLMAIGHDCIGALLFETDNKNIKIESVKGHELSENEVAQMLGELKLRPLGMESDTSDFRISLAGVQEKTALLYWNDKWQRPIGRTPTTHIFKPPMKFETHGLDLRSSVHNEYFCMKFCQKIGLDVANVDIKKFKDKEVLVVERFDRLVKDQKIYRKPQEDMCQALGFFSHQKYQSDGGPNIADIISILQTSVERKKDLENFYKSLVVFYILGAIDGHAKNYSIEYIKQGHRLAPLYDILSIYPALTQKEIKVGKYKMALSVGESNHYTVKRISRRHFIQTAKSCQIDKKRAHDIIDDILRKIETQFWQELSLSEYFDHKIKDKIIAGIKLNAQRLKDG